MEATLHGRGNLFRALATLLKVMLMTGAGACALNEASEIVPPAGAAGLVGTPAARDSGVGACWSNARGSKSFRHGLTLAIRFCGGALRV